MKEGNIIWITGQTGSGKTTLLKKMSGPNTVLLDADELRNVWPGLSYSNEDRWEQNMRASRLAKCLAKQGFDVFVATIAPYEKLRRAIRSITNCTFIWIDHNEYPSDPNRPYEDCWDAEMIFYRKVDEEARRKGKPIPANKEGTYNG
jgi:hypothetical protein